MLQVNLIDGFFVEIDEFNHTLKRNYVGEDKEGKRKLSEKIVGYFPDMPSCVEKMARIMVQDGSQNTKQIVTIREYAAIAEMCFKRCKEIKHENS